MKRITVIMLVALGHVMSWTPLSAASVSESPAGKEATEIENNESEDHGEDLDVKEIIFEHLGDGYGWEVPFSHVYRIPLPVIVRSQDHHWFCFSSNDLTEVIVTKDPVTGKEHEEVVPVVKTVEKDSKTYQFVIASISNHKDKLVEIFPLTAADEKDVKTTLDGKPVPTNVDKGDPVLDGYVFVADNFAKDGKYEPIGKYYREYRPLDLSITKNVLALFISVGLVMAIVFSLVSYYKRRGMRAPRKGMGFIEMLIGFVYYDNIKPTLGDKSAKFAPYLLTCFFFILTMNLVGLMVIFPGGANLTGNIAVTLVLALCTFVVTNVLGTKHYWKDIFWPDVPLWLKFPLPIMQLIEVFGIFTKPAALCVRLFANMMGGHMIVITLTLLIFIFAAFGAGVAGAATVISVLFSIFMLLLDVLVSFIQAYVFTLLSALFIAMAQQNEEHSEGKDDKREDELLEKEAARIDETGAKAI